MASLTWLGHAAFDSRATRQADLHRPLAHRQPDDTRERADTGSGRCRSAVTHGHSDHVGDAVELSKAFPDAAILCQVELKGWLGGKGAMIEGQVPGLNKGGSLEVDGVGFTLVNAFHSSSSDAGEYLGEACGIVVRLERGRVIYFAGDTCVFGDMRLIAEIYKPDYAVLPIGDHFTMGPREAAVALELLGNPICIRATTARSRS